MKDGTVILTSGGMMAKKYVEPFLFNKNRIVHIAHIITAAKVDKDVPYFYNDKKEFMSHGFKHIDIDIEGKNENQLFELLKNFDVIYVQGGSASYLLKQTKKSGFDKVIKRLIKQGKTYVGVSAGTYLACPNIKVHFWKGYRKKYGLSNFRSMSLVPFLVAVHYEDIYKKNMEQGILLSHLPVYILKDDQALVVKDYKTLFLGNEAPTILDSRIKFDKISHDKIVAKWKPKKDCDFAGWTSKNNN